MTTRDLLTTRNLLAIILCAGALGACAASPASLVSAPTFGPGMFVMPATSAAWAPATVALDDDDHGLITGLVMYLPNRIFDLFDIVRARVRVGPGFGVGVRATEVADAYLGSYISVWVGLPGPRGEAEIPWPFGFESLSGAELSVVDATLDAGTDPDYGVLEFGADIQVLLVGVAVGIEPFEILDFLTGLIGIDLSDDDL